MFFKHLDAVGNGRGRDMEFLGRLGEALAAGRGFKKAQAIERQGGMVTGLQRGMVVHLIAYQDKGISREL